MCPNIFGHIVHNYIHTTYIRLLYLPKTEAPNPPTGVPGLPNEMGPPEVPNAGVEVPVHKHGM